MMTREEAQRQFAEIEELRERFEWYDLLGQGVYGSVHRCINKSNGQEVAVKLMLFPEQTAGGVPNTVIREVGLMRALRRIHHPNILNLLSSLLIPSRYMMMLELELCESNLKQVIRTAANPNAQSSVPYTHSLVQKYMRELLLGLKALHDEQLIHRDLKPENLLIKGNVLKIADFGLGRWTGEDISRPTPDGQTVNFNSEMVTMYYRPPELCLGCVNYSYGVDMWSAGVIFVEMLRCRCPFDQNHNLRMVSQIFNTLGAPANAHFFQTLASWPEFQRHHRQTAPATDFFDTISVGRFQITPEEKDLLRKMLALDPHDRININDALAHPFFSQKLQ